MSATPNLTVVRREVRVTPSRVGPQGRPGDAGPRGPGAPAGTLGQEGFRPEWVGPGPYDYALSPVPPGYSDAQADARITAARGAANGVAPLGPDAKVPAANLPDLDQYATDAELTALEELVGGKLSKSANLSDLTDAGAARNNLGILPFAATGDASGLVTGILPDARLADVIAAGTVGSAGTVPVITYDTKGRITGVATATTTVLPANIQGITTQGQSLLIQDYLTASTGTVTDLSLAHASVNVIFRQVTNNYVTLTTDSPHGFQVGDAITVTGLPAPNAPMFIYNGSYTVAAVPTPTTVQYNGVAGNQGTTASSGQIRKTSRFRAANARIGPTDSNYVSVFMDGVGDGWIFPITNNNANATRLVICNQNGSARVWTGVIGSQAGLRIDQGRLALTQSFLTMDGVRLSGSTNILRLQNEAATAGATLSSGPLAVTLSANQTAWNPGVARHYHVTANAAGYVLHALAIGQVDGQECWVRNAGSDNFTLAHDSAAGAAANRFSLDSGTDRVVRPGRAVRLVYSSSASRWLADSPAPPANAAGHHDGLPISFPLAEGTAATVGADKTLVIPVPRDCTILKAFITAKTAPTGAALIVDVNRNGTSIWATNQANRLQLAAGATSGTQTAFDTTALSEGDLLTIDIDQIGSGAAGQDVLVVLYTVSATF